MLIRNFKTSSYLSGLAATTLNPDIAYGASRLRQVSNPSWNFTPPTPPFSFQGTVSGYTSGGNLMPSRGSVIDKFPFASDANAADVGDLTAGRYGQAGQSSDVNGYTSGGRDPNAIPSVYNIIDKFPFASNANATDVGDLTQTRYLVTGQSSGASGYSSGGAAPANSNVIDKFPFASNANATDVGDLTQARAAPAGQTSPVSGYSSGGYTPIVNIIDKFPFASDANATDVGDLPAGRYGGAGQSSATNGYMSAGIIVTYSNVIEKFPFASDANAADVGDLTQARGYGVAGQSSTASGYSTGGFAPPHSNVIDKFPFASDANATDVGDLTVRHAGATGQQD